MLLLGKKTAISAAGMKPYARDMSVAHHATVMVIQCIIPGEIIWYSRSTAGPYILVSIRCSHINTTTTDQPHQQGTLALSTGLTKIKISVALLMTTTRICHTFISWVPLLHRNRKGRAEVSDKLRSGGGSCP